MTQQAFEAAAAAKVGEIVDCIAQGDCAKLAAVARISDYWCFDGKNQTEAIADFAEWLQGQLELWGEEDRTEYVIDPFTADNLELGAWEDNYSFTTYNPTSHGEELELWFEFELTVDANDALSAVFNVNV